MKSLTVFIGYDPREHAAYRVAATSLLQHASVSVSIRPICLDDIHHIFYRPIERREGKLWCPISEAPMATEFAISRFIVPFLKPDGWALFCDCDVLFLADVKELFDLVDDRYAVMCVKHKHIPTEKIKMDGQLQTFYARKNWSSVVLWNCNHEANDRLSLHEVNTWPGRDLHAFKWLEDDEIGPLPLGWNYLVDVSLDYDYPKLLHYTLGGPWLPNWKGGSRDEQWLASNSNCDSLPQEVA